MVQPQLRPEMHFKFAAYSQDLHSKGLGCVYVLHCIFVLSFLSVV